MGVLTGQSMVGTPGVLLMPISQSKTLRMYLHGPLLQLRPLRAGSMKKGLVGIHKRWSRQRINNVEHPARVKIQTPSLNSP